MQLRTTIRRMPALAAAILAMPEVATLAAPPTTAPTTSPVDPTNPPVGVVADDWYVVTLQGKKCGHMHSTMERKHDKKLNADVMESVTTMEIGIARGGRSMKISTDERSTERLDGRIVRFSTTTDMSLVKISVSGEVRGDQIDIQSRQSGQTVEATYPLPKGAVMTWGAFLEQYRRGLKPGTKYTLHMYAPSVVLDKATPATIEILDREPVDLYGRTVEAIKTRQSMSVVSVMGEMKVESTSWLSDDYVPLVMEMDLLGNRLRVIQATKSVALQESDPPEFMAETFIPAKLPANADSAKTIVYRITPKSSTRGGEDKLPDLPETAMQRVERVGPAELRVTVTRSGAVADVTPTSRPSDAELEPFRRSSAYVNTNDPEIKRLAKEAAGTARTPLDVAHNIRAFVSDYITTKDLGVGFATASEVARSKQGDCSEHAILTAALLRAAGIPSRGVTGIVHTERFAGRRNVFVWHMWTQAHIDGRWVDLDAALEQDDVDARHIAIGLMTLNDAGLAEMAVPIWNLMGKLRIEAVEVK